MRTSIILGLAALATLTLVLVTTYSGNSARHPHKTVLVSSAKLPFLLLAALMLIIVLIVGCSLMCFTGSFKFSKKPLSVVPPGPIETGRRAVPPGPIETGRRVVPPGIPIRRVDSVAPSVIRPAQIIPSGTLGDILRLFNDDSWYERAEQSAKDLSEAIGGQPGKQIDLRALGKYLKEVTESVPNKLEGDFTGIDPDLQENPDLETILGSQGTSFMMIKGRHPAGQHPDLSSEQRALTPRQLKKKVETGLEEVKKTFRELLSQCNGASDFSRQGFNQTMGKVFSVLKQLGPVTAETNRFLQDELGLTLEMLEGSSKYLHALQRSFLLPKNHHDNVLSDLSYDYGKMYPGMLLAQKRGMLIFFKQQKGGSEELVVGVLSFVGTYDGSKLISVIARFQPLPYFAVSEQRPCLNCNEQLWIQELYKIFRRLDETFKVKSMLCSSVVAAGNQIEPRLLSIQGGNPLPVDGPYRGQLMPHQLNLVALTGAVRVMEELDATLQPLESQHLKRYCPSEVPQRFQHQNNLYDRGLQFYSELLMHFSKLKTDQGLRQGLIGCELGLSAFFFNLEHTDVNNADSVEMMMEMAMEMARDLRALLGDGRFLVWAFEDMNQDKIDFIHAIVKVLGGSDNPSQIMQQAIAQLVAVPYVAKAMRSQPSANNPYESLIQAVVRAAVHNCKLKSLLIYARGLAIKPIVKHALSSQEAPLPKRPPLVWGPNDQLQGVAHQSDVVLRIAGLLKSKDLLSEANLARVLLAVYPQGFVTYALANSSLPSGSAAFSHFDCWMSPSGSLTAKYL